MVEEQPYSVDVSINATVYVVASSVREASQLVESQAPHQLMRAANGNYQVQTTLVVQVKNVPLGERRLKDPSAKVKPFGA